MQKNYVYKSVALHIAVVLLCVLGAIEGMKAYAVALLEEAS